MLPLSIGIVKNSAPPRTALTACARTGYRFAESWLVTGARQRFSPPAAPVGRPGAGEVRPVAWPEDPLESEGPRAGGSPRLASGQGVDGDRDVLAALDAVAEPDGGPGLDHREPGAERRRDPVGLAVVEPDRSGRPVDVRHQALGFLALDRPARGWAGANRGGRRDGDLGAGPRDQDDRHGDHEDVRHHLAREGCSTRAAAPRGRGQGSPRTTALPRSPVREGWPPARAHLSRSRHPGVHAARFPGTRCTIVTRT